MPATQTRPAPTPVTAPPGGGGRTGTGRRTGYGGGGGGDISFNYYSDVAEATELTESEYDNYKEEGLRKRRGLEIAILEEQCKTLAEKRRAQNVKTEKAEVETQIAQAELSNTQGKLQGVQQTGALIAAKNQAIGIQTGIAQDHVMFLSAQRPMLQGLKAQNLMSLQLQLQESSARNQHQQQLLQYKGWVGGALPSGGGAPISRSQFQLRSPRAFG